MKNVMVLIIVLGFLFIGSGVAQAQELIWVKDNFNFDAGNWAQWWGAYTTVARVLDLPNTGDKTLQCTFANMGDGLATGIYDPNGFDAGGNPDIADTLTMEIFFPLDFPMDSCSRITLVCQPQTAPWSTWYEVDLKPSIVLGQWNHVVMNIDSLKNVSLDYTVPLKVGPRFYTTGNFTATYYIDNIILHGVQKPVGVFASPKMTVASAHHATLKGQQRYSNRIRWYDLPVNISETYNLYASKTGVITNISSPNVVKLASGVGRGELVYNHWVYSTNSASETWYYAMTASATDTAGAPIESALVDSARGTVTGPTTVPYIIPLVANGSFPFAPDADLQEFVALSATMTGMHMQPEYPFGPSAGTSYATDAEVPVDLNVFDYDLYMVMDNDNLYMGGYVKDDHIGTVMQLWQGESADIFWSFYNADTVKSWPSNMTSANGDHRFGVLWGASGSARWPSDGGADGAFSYADIETSIDSLDDGSGTAVWEARVALSAIPTSGGTGFTPVNGMMMPFAVWTNTVDNGARGQVLILGCADNNTSGLGQEDKILAVNPNRWSRPNTWGQIRLSTTNLVAVNEQSQIPDKFTLEQNYPNPFNPSTKINFNLAVASNVKLTVFNILGQKVATLVDGFMGKGAQSVNFDASKLTSGIYFYRLETGSFTANKKMMLVK